MSSFQSQLIAQQAPLAIAADSTLSNLEAPLRAALPTLNLAFTFSSSGILAERILGDAPFDVFLAAGDDPIMGVAQKGKILREDLQIFATGRLALWSKSGQFQSLEDLAKARQIRIAVPDPQSSPYGLAVRQMLDKSGFLPAIGPNLKIVGDAKQCLEMAEAGTVDAAITGWSLVNEKNGVLLPADLHSPIRHIGAELRKSKQKKAARRLMEFLTSTDGRKLLMENGLFVTSYSPSLKK